ncbi:hypothetical protein CFAM422_000816 [Trichoderma lentiforme]|uniref:Uncharacterized protein n=1 Tax=Trichoderma lentiforme TaxID=1567552 RepID=A0A9P5CJK6_9HYPO|nr:hypothetical protein CFAM422_000816 [Trichoderma lentiforme]
MPEAMRGRTKSRINGEVATKVTKMAIEEEFRPRAEDGWLHVAASAEHLSAMGRPGNSFSL